MENDLEKNSEEISTLNEAQEIGEIRTAKIVNRKPLIMGLILFLVVAGAVAVGAYFFYPSSESSSTKKMDRKNLTHDGSGPVSDEDNACSSEYEKLLASHKIDETLCGQGNVRMGEFKEAEIKKVKTNIVLIFDSSGSMAARIGDKTKMDIAKNATNRFVENIKSSGANLSIILYGHKGSNSIKDKAVSCAGIDEVYWLDAVKPEIVKEKFGSAKPTGWTPIAKSLEMAKDVLMKKTAKEDNNIIILVSDGEETCNGNPIENTKAIKNAGHNIKVNVIGFDVGGVTESQLRMIAEAGDGKYSAVKNEKDFEIIFQEQQNMLNKMDFAVKSGVEKLYDVSASILKYDQCQMMLNLEEAGFMLGLEKEISSKCRKYAEEKYFQRFDQTSADIKKIFEQEKAKF